MDRARYVVAVALLVVAMLPTRTVLAASMLPPTAGAQDAPQPLQDAVAAALAAHPPSTASYYAITSYSQTQGVWLVSVIGVDVTQWTLDDAVWTGLVAVSNDYTTAAVQGTPEFDALTANILTPMGGTDALSLPVLPWKPGTKAIYGVLGLHGGQNYVAVDWVSGDDLGEGYAPNAVYASETATITFVCRGVVSVAVYAGRFLYMHLLPNAAIKEGATLVRGQRFAQMKPGSFDDGECGWASQAPNHYHVHWGILRSSISGNTFMVDGGWVLDLTTGEWRNGTQVVQPGDVITAPGVGSGAGTGGGVSGGSFWDPLVNAVINMASRIYPNFPDRASWGLAARVVEGAKIVIRVFYVLAASNFNLSIPLTVLTMILVLEPIRLLYAAWMLVKKIIPFAG